MIKGKKTNTFFFTLCMLLSVTFLLKVLMFPTQRPIGFSDCITFGAVFAQIAIALNFYTLLSKYVKLRNSAQKKFFYILIPFMLFWYTVDVFGISIYLMFFEENFSRLLKEVFAKLFVFFYSAFIVYYSYVVFRTNYKAYQRKKTKSKTLTL